MSHKGEAYPASEAFLLDNPRRRQNYPPSELIGELNISPDNVVMDFGCGPGYYTIEIAKKAKTTFAVDISPEMLEKAKDKAAKNEVSNIEFLQSDGKHVQLSDASVDLILLVTVYHEVGENDVVLAEFSRILKPSGRLVIVEVIKKDIFQGAPVQNPEKLQTEIEASSFKLEQMQPYKNYGILFFKKAVGTHKRSL
ncbi:MAG: class I SAM-dependent methyltransferase [Candidatus Bathyarchaeota archaeon]|nr:class I SAM-dependent methyltransferase [Candidatus Bathyarchaeota archaeon]